MSAWRYLIDKAADIIVYFAAAGTVYIVAYLDANMAQSNLNYMMAILLAMGAAYLIVDYIIKRGRIRRITALDADKARIGLPPPCDYKEQCYQQMIHRIIKTDDAALSKKDRDNKQEIAFLTTAGTPHENAVVLIVADRGSV